MASLLITAISVRFIVLSLRRFDRILVLLIDSFALHELKKIKIPCWALLT